MIKSRYVFDNILELLTSKNLIVIELVGFPAKKRIIINEKVVCSYIDPKIAATLKEYKKETHDAFYNSITRSIQSMKDFSEQEALELFHVMDKTSLIVKYDFFVMAYAYFNKTGKKADYSGKIFGMINSFNIARQHNRRNDYVYLLKKCEAEFQENLSFEENVGMITSLLKRDWPVFYDSVHIDSVYTLIKERQCTE